MEGDDQVVRTVRYLCSLSIAHFNLTGQFYSRIAAAAVFITYNKFSADTELPVIQFPDALRVHSKCNAKDLEAVVKEMLSLATRVEEICSCCRVTN